MSESTISSSPSSHNEGSNKMSGEEERRRQQEFLSGPIPLEELERVHNWKYKAVMSGWVDNAVMTPWWEAVTSCLPRALHPNVLTAVGNSLNIVAAAIVVASCGGPASLNCQAPLAPSWVFFAVALCVFLYQTLDAVDGKQARRLQIGSAFGQMWDHGLDALTWPFFFVANFGVLGFGRQWRFVLSLFCTLFAVYVSYWEARHTRGGLRWAEGTTEGQLLAILVASYIGLAGPGIFGVSIGVGGLTVLDVIVVVALWGPLKGAAQGVLTVRASKDRQPWAWLELLTVLFILTSVYGLDVADTQRAHSFIIFGLLVLFFSERCIASNVSDVLDARPLSFPCLYLLPLCLLSVWIGDEWRPVYAVGGVTAMVWLHRMVGLVRQFQRVLGFQSLWLVRPRRPITH